ncbi:MAG: type 2 isopentenyl-diphosphate Delta-isomerase [Thermoplasmatota archaeon]
MDKIESRKDEHVRIALEKNVSSIHNYWDDIELSHNALPEINKDDIDTSTILFDKNLRVPIVIAAMTGGYNLAKEINERLAGAASHFQIAMGVGSQRAALENSKLRETYGVIKEFDIPLRIANIGASQIVLWGHKKTISYIEDIISMIDAHAVAICLNFLQEVVQPEGEPHAKGCLHQIQLLADEIDTPVIVKESGAGISYDVALRLSKTNIAGIDVGGKGGTSFAAIEHYRAKMHSDYLHARSGETFWNWGISTPQSIVNAAKATKMKFPLIATGGIRHGLDVAKALSLGAQCAGIAQVLLKPATKSKQATILEIETIIKELRTAMFLMGIDSVGKMKEVTYGYRKRDESIL